MIKNEIMSDILKTIKSVHIIDQIGNTIHWQGTSIEGNIASGTMNIYEAANKCKRLAFINGYELLSRAGNRSQSKKSSCNICTLDEYIDEGRWFNGATEPEAIFKAYEWTKKKWKD